MDTNTAVGVRNLGKQYRVGGQEQIYKTLRDTLANSVAAPVRRLRSVWRNGTTAIGPDTFWALRELSFDIRKGEVVGIIGPNGAGKSTLLKILSRITEPTEGSVLIRGPVGSLLEVGTGFHPELTGRENIYLNGAILGMQKHDIDRKFDEIVTFSGVEKFIDTPVKHYSTGMGVRLAFSVAAHLEPEVLLVDEVLAVGDAAFQKKCLSKMRDIASSGCTVLLVSHNMDAIANLCSRAIWIDRGRVRADGPVRQVVHSYMLHATEGANTTPLEERQDRSGYGQIRFTKFSLEDINGNSITAVRTGTPVNLVAAYTAHGEPVQDARVWFDIRDSLDGRRLMRFYSMAVGADFTLLPPEGKVICEVPQFPLLPGTYSVDIHSRVNYKIKADIIYNAASIKVIADNQLNPGLSSEESGLFVCDHTWSVQPALAEQHE